MVIEEVAEAGRGKGRGRGNMCKGQSLKKFVLTNHKGREPAAFKAEAFKKCAN